MFSFSLICLSLFSGLRIGVKPDYFNYEYIYNEVTSGFDFIQSNYYQLESGYIYLNELFSFFNFGFHFFLFCIAFFSLLLTLSTYKYFTKYYLVALLVYISFLYIVRDLGAIRAGLAYSILLFSIIFLFKNKTFWFFSCVFIASLFHGSSSLFFIVYFIFKAELSWKVYLLILITSIMFSLSGLSQVILDFLSNNLHISYFHQKVLDYTKESQYSYELGLFDITNVKNIFISCIAIWVIKTQGNMSKIFKFTASIFIFGTSFRLAFSDFAAIAGRTSSLFLTVEPLFLSLILDIFERKIYKLFIFVFIVLYAMLMLYMGLNKYETLPYDSIIF